MLCITPPKMSEIGNADSYLSTNRRIVRNTVAVNYLDPHEPAGSQDTAI
jgi:hypothetical protein